MKALTKKTLLFLEYGKSRFTLEEDNLLDDTTIEENYIDDLNDDGVNIDDE